jgi:hypothetical protein
MRRAKYLNAVLTVNAVLLSALVADRLLGGDQKGLDTVLAPAPASAQPDTEGTGGLVSAADQRKAQIAELRKISSRLDKIESRLAAGLNVKVTEMPELKLPKEPAKP